MLKTNSKEVKTAVRQYIIGSVVEKLQEYEITTDKPCSAFWQIVKKEGFDPRHVNDYETFKYYMEALACSMGEDVYLHGARDLVASWLQQTAAEKEKYTEEQSTDLACKLIYRELMALIKIENK